MKIITENAIYVQLNDIAYLNQTDLEIPVSIFMKVFGGNTVIIDDSNRYEFVKFNLSKEIEFFKGIDWILDYNEVKDLSEEEIIKLGQSIAKEKNSIAHKFNSMKPKKQKDNMNMVSQCELLDFKMYSLRDVLLFKQGHIKIDLPEGIDFPIGFEQEKSQKKLTKNY